MRNLLIWVLLQLIDKHKHELIDKIPEDNRWHHMCLSIEFYGFKKDKTFFIDGMKIN